MKRLLIVICFFTLSATNAFASEKCYQLYKEATDNISLKDFMCLELMDETTNQYKISFNIRVETFFKKTVAHYFLNYKGGDKGQGVNKATYGILNPSHTVFNSFDITFDGKNNSDGIEVGTVTIAGTKMFYEEIRF